MNCERANSLLSAYLDRELTPEEKRVLRLHLMHCGECSLELQDLEELKMVLGRLTVTAIPSVLPWLRARVAEIETPGANTVVVWQYPWFRRTCAVAALLLIFGLGTALLAPQRGEDRAGTIPGTSPGLASPLPQANWAEVRRAVISIGR